MIYKPLLLLTERQREALYWRMLGLTYQQVAHQLEITKPAAFQLIIRARYRLETVNAQQKKTPDATPNEASS